MKISVKINPETLYLIHRLVLDLRKPLPVGLPEKA